MNRAELKAIAHGLKSVRPKEGALLVVHDHWTRTVKSVAESLQLADKALSNFYAACGFIHRDTKETP